MPRYLCIHGNFSLPPRRDPFTGELLREVSVAPFRNLYEQVTADCYRPNAVLGNFDLMSFDVAPQLLDWLERRDAATYSRILAADRGNAMATTFHHVLLPLASRRDKRTQVAWGLRAFQIHFGRKAEGLWLTDMAVDDETLDVLAESGIVFTQVSSEQVLGNSSAGAGPYRVRTANGRELAIFVRDHALSDKVAFELNRLGGAGIFAARHLAPRADEGLLLIATDGETYGHCHTGEEMFLRYLVRQEASHAGYQVVSLSGFLRDHPPKTEIQIVSPSSWGCVHGVARWQRECDCARPAAWKAPLRQAFVHLADMVDAVYEREARAADLDPWAVRDGYIDVLMNSTPGPIYLAGHQKHALAPPTVEHVLLLLVAQVHRLAMFDSYSFFDTEFDTPDMRNVLAHAARAVSFVAQATGQDLSGDLQHDLARASDPSSERTAADIYAEIVKAHQANGLVA